MPSLAFAKYSLFVDDLQHVVDRTRLVWHQVQGRRIFVTGGTGFFGKWLAETFLHANETLGLEAEMVVLTRDPHRFLGGMPHLAGLPALHFHAGDVRDFDFPAGSFSHIIHAATEASAQLNEQSPRMMYDVIVDGTQRVLDFARKCNAEKLLLASSGAVYGQQPPGMTHVPEDYAGAPTPFTASAAYGEGKRVAEMLGAMTHRQNGLDVRIARCFAFVGPYLPLDTHFAIGNFLRNALAGETISVNGDGMAHRSYLYAADLATWLWTILFRGETCRPYNVGSDQAYSISEIAHAVAELREPPLEVQIAKTPAAKVTPSYYVPSIERARHALGLNVDIDFKTALARTFQWHQRQN
jgi:nucleoside-diphosphate-sugar epimerase